MLYHDSVFKVLLEDLEPRIAPAVFMISGGTVVDSEGNDVTTDYQDEADAVGATKAVLLKKGDSLIVDADGDGKFTKGSDTLVAKIKGGASLMFFTDTDASSGIDVNEITGLAVSNKFGGTLNANVHGDIATVLNADLTLNTERMAADASIAKLKINGFVERNITASSTISGLTIESAPGQRSVAGIAVSNYSGKTLSFGGDDFYVGYAESWGKKTSISKISIYGGVDSISAGPNFGKGGSISGISIVNTINGADLRIKAGSGIVTEQSADGGSISGVRLAGEDFRVVDIRAGGGASGYLGMSLDGGDGGSVKKISIVSGVRLVSVVGGIGGDGRMEEIDHPDGTYSIETGGGGSGGSISGISISEGVEELTLYGGDGGKSAGNNASGAGGSVTSVTASLVGEGIASIIAGRGGNADKDGGAGGSIQKISLLAENSEGLYLRAGDGGNSRSGHGFAFAGAGGAGGSISKFSVKSSGATGNIDLLEVVAGVGGNAGYGYRYTYSNGEYYTTMLGAKGGAGGSVKSIVISNLVAKSLEIVGGSGGDSTYKFDGASGGSVSSVTAVVADLAESSITGGSGGRGSSDYGASNGPEGKVSGINVTQDPATA